MAKKGLTKDFLEQLSALTEGLRRQIDATADGWDIAPDAVAERRRLVCNDISGLEYFDQTYFPHYGTAPPSELHKYLYSRLPQIVNSPKGQRDAIAAPRGEAKSTKISLIFILYCIVRQLKHYPLIFMDAFEQSAEMLEALKVELESNPRLASDFPEVCGQGRVWRVGCIVTANDIKVEAFGIGKRVRGRRHGPHRPDLAVVDDGENDENSATPAQRDKLERYITKAILSLGPVDDSMDAIMVGTVLHYDSVLSRFLKHPMWNGKVFKAIIQWPSRMDMWDQFEHLLKTGDTPQAGEATAMLYYASNQSLMDEGAIVSWPAVRPLVKLMVKRARDGHEAFDSEQQNDPISGEDAPFAGIIQFWVHRENDWVFYGAIDPSLGLHGKGRDPSALLVGGWSAVRMNLSVIEAKIRKRTPDKIISDVILLQTEWDCIMWACESVQFQEFLRTELLKRSVAAGMPVPAMGTQPHHDKTLRIEALQPFVQSGQILLHASQTTLIDQLRHFPKADHDDGPDALEMLWKLAVRGGLAFGVSVGSSGEQVSPRKAARAARREERRQAR